MGIVSTVLSFFGKDVKVDRGSGDNVTAQHFGPSGDDSPPLAGDYAVLSNAAGTGRQSAVGYRDAKNAGEAAPGEKRLYARNSSGVVMATIWATGAGEISIFNNNGAFTLEPNGDVVINGVRISKTGVITLPNGVILNTHLHAQPNDSAGNTEANTSGPI
ncbi:putative baseplate assembly protein [Acinetobacter phage Scuro]|nr:putative baseplate assembly protein [Acinetobacter phage Scuro]